MSGLYPYDHYDCSTYALTYNNTDTKCFGHYISTKSLRVLILDTIRMVSGYAISNEADFIQKVREVSEVRQKEAAKELKRQLGKAKKRCTELDGLIKKLYESFAAGHLTEKRFAMLSGEYEREQAELETVIAQDSEKLDAYESDTDRVDQFLALAKRYTDFSVLDHAHDL